VKLELLVSPVKLKGKSGRLAKVEFIKNELGEVDASGRRRPVAMPGSERRVPLDTLIVAIGEEAIDVASTDEAGIEMKGGAVVVDKRTLTTGRPGVFAGGDLATGPNTVIDAIAAGRRAAEVIDRYLGRRELCQAAEVRLPSAYVEPVGNEEGGQVPAHRARATALPALERVNSFAEVEASLTDQDAAREARRCLRCDLEFTRRSEDESALQETNRGSK
jgi:NADH-quinone oxidoreductase subunit F